MFRGKLITLFILVFMLSGCAALISKPEPYKALALTKATAEEIAATAKTMYAEGKLSEENFEKVRKAYTLVKKAQDAVIDVFIVSLELGMYPESNPDYVEAIKHLDKLSRGLLNLALELGILKK